MKTTVSTPDDVFDRVERLARRGRRSRSDVYSSALREYVARHAPEEVTDAMNRVCAEVQQGGPVPLSRRLARVRPRGRCAVRRRSGADVARSRARGSRDDAFRSRHLPPDHLAHVAGAPFNAQVNRIAGKVGPVPVGTVDKFQGQTCAVVIYSMPDAAADAVGERAVPLPGDGGGCERMIGGQAPIIHCSARTRSRHACA